MKRFKSSMSFDKSELQASVHLDAVGINMPYSKDIDYGQEFLFDKDWLQLGFFGGSNDPKFYENLKSSEIIPKEEDFIEVPFRLITATIVGGGTWKSTDFSNAKVLKGSMQKLEGKPVYKDHETDLNNWVGIIKAVKWTAATTQNGVKVPAGIDGILAIDAKTNPKVARGILLGAIFSNSVTVDFEWEMSHTFENEYDFYDKIGTLGKDGKMIRRVVKTIHDYYESSLVWLGADPFAKAITEGGDLKHIDTTSIYEYTKQSFIKKLSNADKSRVGLEKPEDVSKSKNLVINFALDEKVLSLAHKEKVTDHKKDKSNSMKNLMAAFILHFGSVLDLKEGDELTEEKMVDLLGKVSYTSEEDKEKIEFGKSLVVLAKNAVPDAVMDAEFIANHTIVANTKITALEEEIATLQETKVALDKEVGVLKPLAELGTSFTKQRKDEAIKLYKLTVGTKHVDEAVIALFDKADNDAVTGLLNQYVKSATSKFSGSCAECGSSNFKFQSSLSIPVEVEDELVSSLSVTELRDKYTKNSMNIGK